MLLVLRFLEGDERLAPSFEALRAQAEGLGLLGERPSWDGSTRRPVVSQNSAVRSQNRRPDGAANSAE